MIEYVREDNRVLREQLGDRRLRLNDDQRRRLAARARGLGRNVLAQVATIVTPETPLRSHRQLIAHKYDGTGNRGPGHPRAAGEVEQLGFGGLSRTGIVVTDGFRVQYRIWDTTGPARSLTFCNDTVSSRRRSAAVRPRGKNYYYRTAA